MSYPTLLCDQIGAVALVTLNRPEVLNALNTAVFDDLEAVFTDLAADPSVRAILLTGAGEKAFAAGADIRELAEADAVSGEAKALRGQRVFDRIERSRTPVIALVNGFALGGGCELAMSCHLRIASTRARFGQPEVKLGLIPGYGGTQRLPRLVGPGAALKLLLTGEMVAADEALRLGLVEEVVAPEDLLSRGQAIAALIAAAAPLAVTGVLQAVRDGQESSVSDGFLAEARIFGHMCDTADKAEGTTAFLTKRPPIWTGR